MSLQLCDSPVQPARQRQMPATGSQPSELRQSHLSLQSGPYEPSWQHQQHTHDHWHKLFVDYKTLIVTVTVRHVRAVEPLWSLTGHGTSQYSSLQPGEQVQVPLTGSQAAPLAHWHVWLQLGPQVPLEHGMEQSTPCQPGRGRSQREAGRFISALIGLNLQLWSIL